MSDQTHGTGSCLCGSVHFSASNMGTKVGACHCAMHRKWGGSAFMEVDCGTDVEFDSDDNRLIDDDSDLVFDHQVCIDERPLF